MRNYQQKESTDYPLFSAHSQKPLQSLQSDWFILPNFASFHERHEKHENLCMFVLFVLLMFRIVQKVHDVFETPKQSPVRKHW